MHSATHTVSQLPFFAFSTLLLLVACGRGDPLVTAPAETLPVGPLLAKPASDSVRIGVILATGGSYRVQSDGLGEYIHGLQGIRAVIDAPGNLQIGPVNGSATTPPQRTLVFDYSAPADPANSYRPDGSGQWNWKIKTGNAGQPRIQDLAIGASRCYPATIAQDNGRTHHRDVFNPASDPQATYVQITRTSASNWTVVSDGQCQVNPNQAAVYSQDMTVQKGRTAPLIFRGYYDQRLSIEIRVLP